MKFKVELSRFSSILTILTLGLLIVALIATRHETDKFILLAVIILAVLIPSMFYAPLSVTITDKEVCVNSPFKIHTIPMRRIVSAERFQPTMGSIRIIGSGGFMGYFGIFREGDVGRYTAYYGKASDCLMLRLDNGDQYVIGCKDPDTALRLIRSHLPA